MAVSSTVRVIENSEATYTCAPSGATAIPVELGFTGSVATPALPAVSMTVSAPFDAA